MSTENLKVYRYNFRPSFVSILYRFSKVHQYDSCNDFKEAFEKWEETHSEKIQEETIYLETLGYVGDFRTKMFKSARYYFRKKDGDDIILDEETDKRDDTKPIKKSTNPRKKYTSIDYELSTKITEYIEFNHMLKPSHGFELFCEIYRKEVDEEINRLEGEGEGEGEGLLKIKKTFKNKHFNKKRELLQQLRNDNL